jgi:hypothetical protein
MKKYLAAILSALTATGFWLAPATADDKLVTFRGGIGATPLRAGGLVNDVLGVNPGGRPWVIRDLDAGVKANGEIKVKGKGLILAGLNYIGTV